MELWPWMLAALAMVTLGYSLFRGFRQQQPSQKQNTLTVAADFFLPPETALHAGLQQLERCADDDSRDITARINHRLASLDQLIVEADQEIERLETLLAHSRSPASSTRPVTAHEQQRCFALREAGFAVAEIARRLCASPESVQAALDEWRQPDRRAA